MSQGQSKKSGGGAVWFVAIAAILILAGGAFYLKSQSAGPEGSTAAVTEEVKMPAEPADAPADSTTP